MRSDRQVWFSLSAAMILVAMLGTSRAHAHRIDVSVDIAEGKIVVEARYHDGVPVPEADLLVTDPDGSLLAEGTTDADGRFLFTLTTVPAQINVVVETGDGHRGAVTVSHEDLARLAGEVEEHEHEGHDSSASEHAADDDSSADHDDLREIEAALVRVETELHEIAHELEHLSERHAGTNLERVLAGVGFILGLTGVAAYCLARRPQHGRSPFATKQPD
ncbi:MAG: hypothetical protein KKI02_09325 [Planctomycetes bacterium]|nr:hypothetical protein [Planctomycetota bacterium]